MRYKVKLLEILLRPSHTHFWLSKTLQLLSFGVKTTFERCYDHFIGGKITATALSKEETLYKIGLLPFTAISRLPGWKTFDVERYCFSLERTRRTQISLSNASRRRTVSLTWHVSICSTLGGRGGGGAWRGRRALKGSLEGVGHVRW